MMSWDWVRVNASTDDILDAVRAIDQNEHTVVSDKVEVWMPAQTYLNRAQAALARGGDEGWDTAVSNAKMAACRRIDAFLVHNHMDKYHRKTYGEKIEYLERLQVQDLGIVQELIIEPRNIIEHSYAQANEADAKRAVSLASLFLRATEEQAQTPAVVVLGWSLSHSYLSSSAPGNEFQRHTFTLTEANSPMLVIDVYEQAPLVFVLYPADHELKVCPLYSLQADQLIELNTKLRTFVNRDNRDWGSQSYMREMRQQLRLHP